MNIREVSLRLNEEAERLCQTLLPLGKKVGHQWIVGDYIGSPGDSMAVELTGPKQGQWYDHAAGEGGDLLKLIQLNKGLRGPIQSADFARQFLGLPSFNISDRRVVIKPDEGFDPLQKSWKIKGTEEWTKPTKAWRYVDQDGNTICYVARIDFMRDGKPCKDVLPIRKDETGKWIWKGWKGDEKRPTYGLQFLKANDGRPLLIVEGEKTCDAARIQFPHAICITWQGGSKAVERADWAPWKAWKGPIVIWPDNDPPGYKCALYLKGIFAGSRMVKLPKEIPEKWDLADPIPEGVSPKGLLDACLLPEPPALAACDIPKPYQPLGVDERGYYFLTRTEGYVIHLTPPAMKEMAIFRIAPDTYWESMGFYREKSNKVDYMRAAKFLVEECQQVGAFDDRTLRGLGVCIDEGRVVVHLGDRLMVDGVETAFIDHKSRFMYPKRPAILNVNFSMKLSCGASVKLLEMLEMCSWANKRSGRLLAGLIWCSIMPGALPWRPHGFLQGESTSGKTWILQHIIIPLLREFSNVFLACASSEAGVRQLLGIDSLATLLEEFDTEQVKTGDALNGIVTLARQSSSETGGRGVKGTQDGVARSYVVKSCFTFVGTAAAIVMKADTSRITLLELVKNSTTNPIDFPKLQAMAAATTENLSWVGSFLGRALSLVKETLEAITTFRRLTSRHLNDTRAGDQYGTLLAGAWMVGHDKPPTEQEAQAFLSEMEWGDTAPTSLETDHHACMSAFLAFRADFDDGGHRGMQPIGAIIQNALSKEVSPEMQATARSALIHWGIRVAPGRDGIFIARKHRQVSAIFKETPYPDKWETHFMRLDGNELIENALIGSIRCRAIFIPSKTLFGR